MTSPTQSQPPDAIILPDAPAIPSLGFRHFRGESDYPGIVAVGNASRMAEGLEWILSEDDIANQYSHLVNSDPAKDMIIAELDGRMIGYIRGQWNLDQENAYRHWFHIHMEPDLQGRGIERAMLHWIEARLTEIAAGHSPERPSTLDTFIGEQATGLTALILDEGYERVRIFEHMSRSLAEPLPAVALPPGFELRPVLPEHYRAIWDADREAFLDHYGYHERGEERYQEWLADKVLFRPELWQIAWDTETNEIAGQIRTFIDDLENETYGRLYGYTEFISVRRPFRKRGLARALIAESLRVLKEQGMTTSNLTVDSDSLTGAERLYADCGFVTVSRTPDYRKAIVFDA